LLYAIVQVVQEKGYGPATLADIVDRANVSRTTFYANFPDKESCFLAAFSFGVEFALGRMRVAWEAVEPDPDWRARVRSDLTAYLDVLVKEPAFAWALHVEALAAGPAVLDRRAEMMALFTERTRRNHELARSQDPSLPALRPEVFAIHSGGLDELIRDRLRTAGTTALPELAEPVIAATLQLFGDRTA
jgi:AcrR family transcriptional regulator